METIQVLVDMNAKHDATQQEQELMHRLFGVAGCEYSWERKSADVFDIRVHGKRTEPSLGHPGESITYGFSAWLPLAAIRELAAWTSPAVARMTDYPEMAMAGDWSGIRDSSEDAIWSIFALHVLNKASR